MFVFPPLPPKDHVIKQIPRSLLSSQEFTPCGEVRVTLPEVGIQAVPISATPTDLPPQVPFKEVNRAVVNTWVRHSRYNWLVQPGKEDYFVHDMFKKYNVTVCASYDTRYLHAPPVFPRSFKYELDCLEAFRLKKLEAKLLRDEEEDKRRRNKQLGRIDGETEDAEREARAKSSDSKDDSSFARWQPQPHLFAPSQTDPCKRRAQLGLVGVPFKNQACNWYYKNYPPPKIEPNLHKFSK